MGTRVAPRAALSQALVIENVSKSGRHNLQSILW